jgi:acylphosphatase
MTTEAGVGTDGLVRRHVVVVGRVQGVGYRATCAHRAKRTGVAGWVRNRGDGSVEAAFEGSPEAVENMIVWCHHGPPMAHVRQVVATEEAPLGEAGFAVR